MIYFDNAATTYPKPTVVLQSTLFAMRQYGANPGRGGHEMSFRTSEKIYDTRKNIADFFGVEGAENIIFTKNCTEALNFAIKGVAKRGGHFVCSSLEHNAVVRPLEALKQNGICTYTEAKVASRDAETIANFKAALRPETIAIVAMGASNVFGKVLPIKKLAKLAHQNGKLFILDAAQIAGIEPIDCRKYGIDILCCAGHKGLYGPMGTGVLAIQNNIRLETIIEGGTGSFSAVRTQPENYPERLESGTLNVPGIVGLGAGVQFVEKTGIHQIAKHETASVKAIFDALSMMPNILLYTDIYSKTERFVPLLSFNIKGLHSEETAALLAEEDIALRAGLHCAPLAHAAYGTQDIGTVRIAPSIFTEKKDMNLLLNSIFKIAKQN